MRPPVAPLCLMTACVAGPRCAAPCLWLRAFYRQTKCNRRHPCSRCFDRCITCLPSDGAIASGPYLPLALSTLDSGIIAELMNSLFASVHADGRMDRAVLMAWR
jgi:hypothetical protein